MSQIEIRQTSGDSERRKLSKSHPLSIGSHVSNDVVVEGRGIALLHCRISWNKSAFEVVAAGPSGVEVNGTLVQHAPLNPGDVVRVGELDIEFLGDEEPVGSRSGRSTSSQSSDEIGNFGAVASPPPMPRSSKRDKDSQRSSRKSSRKSSNDEDDISDDLEMHDAKIDENFFEDEPGKKSKESKKSRATRAADLEDELEEKTPTRLSDGKKSRVRPGEQDALRSPIIHILIYGALALLLMAGIFWFWIGRDQANELFSTAKGAMEGGQYAGAIELFTQFANEFPRDPRVAEANINRGRCRVLSYIKAASPAWQKGLTALQEFIEENRSKADFSELYPDLVEYAGSIAEGAANSALASRSSVPERKSLLETSTAARALVDRYAPKDTPPVELATKIDTASQNAEASILKQSTFEQSVATVEQAIQASNAMGALEGRRSLLDRYPEFENDPKVAKLLEQILAIEKTQVTSEEFVREALRDEHSPAPFGGLTLTLQSRARTDTVSEGRVVFAVAKDCCYGIDSITGAPIWRRVIGPNTPFFPVSITSAAPAILLFDTNHQELVVVERESGKLVWRQPLEEGVSGPPLIEAGQLFVATLGNHLYRIDAGTGRISARLRFSQKLLSPPALNVDKTHLVVAGDREVFYTLTMRPFECIAVSYVGHAPGTIKAPLLTMGALILAVVNHQADSSQLRVFDTRNAEGRLMENVKTRAPIKGIVRDQPTLRGNQLFVTSSGQRIANFAVSDATNQPPLTTGPTFQGQSPHEGPMYLMAGAENQLWMSTDMLRKLQVAPNAIAQDPHTVSPGLSSQPMQLIGRNIYAGRRLPFSDSVFFSLTDREDMTSQWRIVLGASILAWTTNDAGATNCLTDDGSVFALTAAEIATGGFKSVVTTHLEAAEASTTALRGAALPSGRIAVASGGAKPQVWIIGERGQLERQVPLTQPLETNPIEIASGVVLPVTGRLRLVPVGAPGKNVADYVAPVSEGKAAARWVQLAVLDSTQFVGLNDGGQLTRFQYRPEPTPHIDVAQPPVQLQKPVELPVDVQNGRILVCDTAGSLLALDAATLDTLASTALESPANASPYFIEGRVYVTTARSGLVSYELVAGDLKKVWAVPMENAALAGPPLLVNGKLIAALNTGQILALSPADGAVVGKIEVGQALTDGPKRVGNKLVVPSLDGTLHTVESVLQAAKQ